MQVNPYMNNYFRRRSKIPKSIKIFFLILHLMFGHDFGFGNLFRKKVATFLKYHSVLITLVRFVTLLLPFKQVGGEFWYWFNLTECAINFSMLRCAKYTVFNLLSDIHAAERIPVLEKETFGVFTALYAFTMVTVQGLLVGLRCTFDDDDIIVYCVKMHPLYLTFYVLCPVGMALIPDSEIVIYYYIYAYVIKMKQSLKQDLDIQMFIDRYNKIAYCYDRIRHVCSKIVSIYF